MFIETGLLTNTSDKIRDCYKSSQWLEMGDLGCRFSKDWTVYRGPFVLVGKTTLDDYDWKKKEKSVSVE